MAKVILCDECGEQADLESTFLTPPDGWITIHRQGVPDDAHYCRAACAVVSLTNDLTVQQKPLLKEVMRNLPEAWKPYAEREVAP